MRSGWLAVLAASLFAVDTAAADTTAMNRTSGLAIGAGLGYHVPTFGGELQYHQALAPRWWLVPYAGVGYFPTEGPSLTGAAGGVMAAWGERHRIVADVGIGLAGAWQFPSILTGNVVEVHPLYGVVWAGGYQYVSDGGFWICTMLGASYLLEDQGPGNSRWVPTTNVTAGYKIW